MFIEYSADYIFNAPVVYADGAFYIIGGNPSLKAIGRLDSITMVWSKAGDLVNGRYGHNAIFDGSSIIVVGGGYVNSNNHSDHKLKTEKCELSGGKVTCHEQNPLLDNYTKYPELFLVQAEFCKNLP